MKKTVKKKVHTKPKGRGVVFNDSADYWIAMGLDEHHGGFLLYNKLTQTYHAWVCEQISVLPSIAKAPYKWEWIGDGQGIHWPALDEDLSMEGILQGRPSFESQKSFQKWATERKKKGLTVRWS